jgi:hypothetical protein
MMRFPRVDQINEQELDGTWLAIYRHFPGYRGPVHTESQTLVYQTGQFAGYESST